jgi:hypothetical protein
VVDQLGVRKAQLGDGGQCIEPNRHPRGGFLCLRQSKSLVGYRRATESAHPARGPNEARFELLIACAFNFDAHSSELRQLATNPTKVARSTSRVWRTH